MTSRVLETWLNDTLSEAEHLDIPGVILIPEHKEPIARYSIDRVTFGALGIPGEFVDRVYRALFVYSVGFYELIRKILDHAEGKYSLITSVWKVFSILLEYCCRTDYRMLFSEIQKENKKEIDAMDACYQNKFMEQQLAESLLKRNQESMIKALEDIQRDFEKEQIMRK